MTPLRLLPFLTTFAILLAASPGVAQGVPVEEASEDQKAAAQQLFLAGDESFDVQDYEDALKCFRDSYGEVASPNSRLMIARSLLELGRLDEAYDEYNGVLKDSQESETYTTTHATASREREALKNRLAWLTLDLSQIPDGAEVRIAGRVRELSGDDEGYGVTPGATIVVATSEDGTEARAEVHLAAGRKATAKLKMGEEVTIGTPSPKNAKAKKPVKAETKPRPAASASRSERVDTTPWAITAGSIGVLGLTSFATFGLLSGSKHKSLQQDCRDGNCPTSSQNDIDSGKRMQLFANIGLGVGVAGLGTSVVLYLLNRKHDSAVRVNVGFSSLALGGAF